MSSPKKVIAVVGSTGKQGGGLVQAILNDPNGDFAVRALTRDPTRGKAMTLAKQGADVVKLDMDDPSTLGPALHGVHGVFVVTNYWEHGSMTKEQSQAKAIADAAVAVGVDHIIWSTLENTTQFFDTLPRNERPPNTLDNGYYVPHFDSKAECNVYFPKNQTTFLHASFYMENLMGMIQNGVFTNNMSADSPLPVIASVDIGKCAYGIFKAGNVYKGTNVYIAGDVLSCKQIMDVASNVTGITDGFRFESVSLETYATSKNNEDIANMFYFYDKSQDYVKNRDPTKARELNPELQTTQMWMEANKDDIRNLAA